MALRRAGRGEHALELHAGEHVGVAAVAEFAAQAGLELLVAGREDDRADVHGFGLGLHVVDDGAGTAGLHALHALAAQTASQAALGLGHGLFGGVAGLDLAEVPRAILDDDLGHILFGRDLGSRIGIGRDGFLAGVEHGHGLAAQIRTDGLGRMMSVRHGLDQRSRSQHHVAAGEDSWHLRGERGVGRDLAAFERHSLDVRGLADGDDDVVGSDGEVASFDWDRLAPSRGIRLAQLHAQALEPGYLAVAGDDLHGIGQQLELHALFLGLLNFLGQSGHFNAATAIDNRHFLRAHAQGSARGVHGHVATADDNRLLARGYLLAQVHGAEEVEPVHHALRVVAGQAHLLALVRASGHEDGGIAVLLESLDSDIARTSAELHAQLDLDALIENLLDLVVEHIARQPVRRHAQAKHAAQERPRLEQRHTVALLGQILRRGQAGRATTNDGDFFFLNLDWRERRALFPVALGIHVIRGETLEVAYGHRLVELLAVALGLAGVLADAAAHGRQRAALLDQLVGLVELAGRNQRHVALGIHARRASGLAWSHALGLRDAVDIGNGLRVGAEHCLARAEVAVEFIGQRHRAGNRAIAAGVALAHVDVARSLA